MCRAAMGLRYVGPVRLHSIRWLPATSGSHYAIGALGGPVARMTVVVWCCVTTMVSWGLVWGPMNPALRLRQWSTLVLL